MSWLVPLSLTWALGFGNLGLLYGLGAASIPLLIHLLNRRRYRETSWAAMRFLLEAIRKNRRRIRIEQWLLLAIRTLVIVLVVLAMAKPFLESFGNVIAGLRTHRVVVLDASLSMGYSSAGVSRFEQAKALATQLVKDSRRGDAISLILMGDPPRVVIGDPSANLSEVQKEIEELELLHGGTDLAATFESIERVLEVSSIRQKELIFLTDLQSTSWRRPVGPRGEGLDTTLAKIEARRPRSVIIDLGRAGSENRAVTDIRVVDPVVIAGSTTILRGLVRNFGPSRADGVTVRLTVDGRVGPEQVLDLPVGEDVSFVFYHQFVSPGDHLVEVSMDSDALALDDSRFLVVPVREALNVLLVDGHYQAEPFQAETDYLAQALAPSEGADGPAGIIRAEVVSEAQFSRRDLAAFDVVCLCNVAQFSPTEVSALEDFLRQGGGVLCFGGDQVVADNYNRLLHAEGEGLLPASIGPTVGDAAGKQTAFGFDGLGYRHPLVADYRGESDPVTAGLTRALTWQYHKLTLPAGSKAQVALAFDTGDPAVIEMPRHRGTVFQFATSADAGWTSWPLHNSYLPVMQQAVLLAAAGRLTDRNIQVGQPYVHAYPPSGGVTTAVVTNPRGQQITTRLKPAGSVSQFQFDQTDFAGAYQVRIGPPLAQEWSFAANPNPIESDLAKLDGIGIAERLPGWNFTHLTNWKELSRSTASVGRRGELHRPLLFAALALLFCESFLAWRFGHHPAPS